MELVSKDKTDQVPSQGWGSRHWSHLQRNAATRSRGAHQGMSVERRGEGRILEMGDHCQGRRKKRKQW